MWLSVIGSPPETTLSKESPPWTSAARLSTRRAAPAAPSSMENPEAFQNRVRVVSRWSCGASMKPLTTTLPSSVRSTASILPTGICLKRIGAPAAIDPPVGASIRTTVPGVPTVVSGGRGRAVNTRCRGPASASQAPSI